MKFDDASWHYDGKFPKGLPKENGGTHIGMFVTWLIEQQLMNREHVEEAADELEQVRTKKMTGREFLFAVLDEALVDTDLIPIGRKFTRGYFNDGNYIPDYLKTFGVADDGSVYTVKDTWKNYAKLKPCIDAAWVKFARKNKQPARRKLTPRTSGA